MRDVVREWIEKLREELPALLKLKQYCHVRNRCLASAYNDLRRVPGLGVKDGRSTRIVRDVMLDDMARMPEWIPEKDRLQPSPLVGEEINPPSRSRKLAEASRQRRKRADQNQEAGAP
jgi:hypothetical protein